MTQRNLVQNQINRRSSLRKRKVSQDSSESESSVPHFESLLVPHSVKLPTSETIISYVPKSEESSVPHYVPPSVPQANEHSPRIITIDSDSDELSSNGSDWDQQQRFEREDELMSEDEERDRSYSKLYLIRKGLSTSKSNLVMPKVEPANLLSIDATTMHNFRSTYQI